MQAGLADIRKVDANGTITTVAGRELVGNESLYWDQHGFGPGGDGGPATEANLHGLRSIAVSADGQSQLIAQADYGFRVRKILDDDTIVTVAGTAEYPPNGVFAVSDGGLATDAPVDPVWVDSLTDGGFVFVDAGLKVRHVDPNGRIDTIAGGMREGTAVICYPRDATLRSPGRRGGPRRAVHRPGIPAPVCR